MARTALELAEKMGTGGIMDGKAPNGIAAAYLYIATNLLGHRMVFRYSTDTEYSWPFLAYWSFYAT